MQDAFEPRPARAAAAIIAFPAPRTLAPGARRPFRKRDADEPRGTILLYTGVRYERLPEPDPDLLPYRRDPTRAGAGRG